MKAKLGAWVLPAEGVKIPNSRMVKVEGAEQEVSFFVKAGRAAERADKIRRRNMLANIIALIGGWWWSIGPLMLVERIGAL
jgi:hypothetical protein